MPTDKLQYYEVISQQHIMLLFPLITLNRYKQQNIDTKKTL
jgi:hypothetical protein